IDEALKAGANAYISKSDGAKALIAAIEALQENRTYFNSRVGEIVLNGFLNTRKMPSQKSACLARPDGPRAGDRATISGRKSTKEAATLGVSVKRSEEHTSELQSHLKLVCRPLLETKKQNNRTGHTVFRASPSRRLASWRSGSWPMPRRLLAIVSPDLTTSTAFPQQTVNLLV